jgi:hypothetical protein
MSKVKEILIKQGYSPEEADRAIKDTQLEFDRLLEEGNLEDAYEVCSSMLGLEPDYLEEFMY